ncbi:unnamed protein product, partial [Candidula unifasciata]
VLSKCLKREWLFLGGGKSGRGVSSMWLNTPHARPLFPNNSIAYGNYAHIFTEQSSFKI